MNTNIVVELVMLLSGGFLALSILFRIHKRSISTFIIFLAFAIVSNLAYYGFIEFALCILIASLVLLLVRAIMKNDNDKLIIKPYRGVEKRNKKRRHA